MNVELRHLRSFVAVAEELSFTRAAARLHLAQPALSAHVRQLEERIGCRLLERTTRRVSLTPAGAALLDAAPGALAAVEEAVASAQAAAAGDGGGGRLALGVPAPSAIEIVPRALRAFEEARPGVRVSVRSAPFDDLSGGVRSGACDVALVWLPFDSAGLEVERLYEDERVVVMAASHPLAATDVARLDVRTVARAPLVQVMGIDEVAADFWSLAEFRDDEPISVGAWITGFDDLFAAVRAGQAIAAVPASVAASLPWDDVVARPVPGLSPVTVALCRRAGDARPVLDAFAAAVRAVL